MVKGGENINMHDRKQYDNVITFHSFASFANPAL